MADDDDDTARQAAATASRPNGGSLSKQLGVALRAVWASDSPEALFADHQAAGGSTHFAVEVNVVQGVAPGGVAGVVLLVELHLQADHELTEVQYL